MSDPTLRKAIHGAYLQRCQEHGYDGPTVESDTEDDRLVELIASALPELSQLLGELAVMNKAATRLLAVINRELIGESVEERQADLLVWGAQVGVRARDLQAALSSDAGRLAGELIRAVAKERAAEGVEIDVVSHSARQLRQFVDDQHAATEERRTAADAFLARFPGMREEVERG